MDHKYGHIYTHHDVLAIIDRVANTKETEGIEPKRLLQEVLHCDGPFDKYDAPPEITFPADEPLFVLRAKDSAAAYAISSYGYGCSELGCDDKHLEGVQAAVIAFQNFKVDSPDRMKVPD